MGLFNLDIGVTSLIRRRMLQLWVTSYIYYELNDNLVSDETWTRWAKELVRLIKKYPKEFKTIKHWELFKDFDGSTGYYLVAHATPRLISKAYMLLGRKKK